MHHRLVSILSAFPQIRQSTLIASGLVAQDPPCSCLLEVQPYLFQSERALKELKAPGVLDGIIQPHAEDRDQNVHDEHREHHAAHDNEKAPDLGDRSCESVLGFRPLLRSS